LKNWTHLRRQLNELRASMSADCAAAIRAKIRQIVPEYCFQLEGSVDEYPKPQTDAHHSAVAASD
jgi:hypothetical protein